MWEWTFFQNSTDRINQSRTDAPATCHSGVKIEQSSNPPQATRDFVHAKGVVISRNVRMQGPSMLSLPGPRALSSLRIAHVQKDLRCAASRFLGMQGPRKWCNFHGFMHARTTHIANSWDVMPARRKSPKLPRVCQDSSRFPEIPRNSPEIPPRFGP